MRVIVMSKRCNSRQANVQKQRSRAEQCCVKAASSRCGAFLVLLLHIAMISFAVDVTIFSSAVKLGKMMEGGECSLRRQTARHFGSLSNESTSVGSSSTNTSPGRELLTETDRALLHTLGGMIRKLLSDFDQNNSGDWGSNHHAQRVQETVLMPAHATYGPWQKGLWNTGLCMIEKVLSVPTEQAQEPLCNFCVQDLRGKASEKLRTNDPVTVGSATASFGGERLRKTLERKRDAELITPQQCDFYLGVLSFVSSLMDDLPSPDRLRTVPVQLKTQGSYPFQSPNIEPRSASETVGEFHDAARARINAFTAAVSAGWSPFSKQCSSCLKVVAAETIQVARSGQQQKTPPLF